MHLFLALFLILGSAIAGEKSLYDFVWLDADKKVYVLQNKLFKKEKSFYLDLGYISNDTSKFQETEGVQLRTGYYFHEEWGLEAFYNSYQNSNNDDFKNIRIVNSQVPFIRRINSSSGLVAVWSPFYGKVNTFNTIYYFDWSFGLGVASVKGESNLNTFQTVTTRVAYEKENYTGAIARTTFKFHLQENLHVAITYFNTYYSAKSPSSSSKQLRINSDFILSLGTSF